jgi:hypothetical protein
MQIKFGMNPQNAAGRDYGRSCLQSKPMDLDPGVKTHFRWVKNTQRGHISEPIRTKLGTILRHNWKVLRGVDVSIIPHVPWPEGQHRSLVGQRMYWGHIFGWIRTKMGIHIWNIIGMTYGVDVSISQHDLRPGSQNPFPVGQNLYGDFISGRIRFYL